MFQTFLSGTRGSCTRGPLNFATLPTPLLRHWTYFTSGSGFNHQRALAYLNCGNSRLSYCDLTIFYMAVILNSWKVDHDHNSPPEDRLSYVTTNKFAADIHAKDMFRKRNLKSNPLPPYLDCRFPSSFDHEAACWFYGTPKQRRLPSLIRSEVDFDHLAAAVTILYTHVSHLVQVSRFAAEL